MVDNSEDLEDGVQDELVEGSLQVLALALGVLGPLLRLRVEVVVTPQTLLHPLEIDSELLGILDGELADSEAPTMETRTESNSATVGVYPGVTDSPVGVRSDNEIDGLDSTREGLVQIFLGCPQLEQSSVDLINTENRLNALGQGLTQHGLSLDTGARQVVDYDQCTVGDTEGGSDLG